MVCDELKGERVGFLSVYFTSKRVVTVFTDGYNSLVPDTDTFDEFDFEDAVIKCVNFINDNGCFRIHGWLKPSTAAVAIGSNNSPFHVLSIGVIQPSILQRESYKELQYKAHQRSVVHDTPGTVQAGYVVPRPQSPARTSFQQATARGTVSGSSNNSAGTRTSATGTTTGAYDTSNGVANNSNAAIPVPDANTGEATKKD